LPPIIESDANKLKAKKKTLFCLQTIDHQSVDKTHQFGI